MGTSDPASRCKELAVVLLVAHHIASFVK